MNDEGRTAEHAAAPAAAPSLMQRVIMVFTAPAKLGETLRTQAPWFWTLAIVAIVGAIVFALVPADVLRQAVEERARSQEGGPSVDTLVTITRISGSLGSLVMSFITAAIAAGVLYLVFNLAFGLDALYKQHLSGMAHIWWINTLGFLLLIPIWIAKGDMQIALGLGLLLPEAPSTFVGHYLNGITIFGVWASIALGLIESGMSGGRITAGKAVGAILVLYLIADVIKALMAMLGG
ncbi:MAG: hypothetical protein PVI01_16645 [Gemmatimonadales bacterium]|jgi:hypothetical protein